MTSIRHRTLHFLLTSLAVVGLGLLTARPAAADFATGFEPPDYAGAADGSVILTGQNGWYLPNGAGLDSDESVFTYAGNALGLPANPDGQTQFIGAHMTGTPANPLNPRGQLDIDLSSRRVWEFCFDMCGSFLENQKNNLSSFSLSNPADATMPYFILLNAWHKRDGSYRIIAEVYDSTGSGPILVKLPQAFRKLQINTWYKVWVVIDLDQNRVLAVCIVKDGITTVLNPTNWYLAGGAGGGLPDPPALRFFVGGGNGDIPGNIMAWDNLSIGPPTGAPYPGKVIYLGAEEGQVISKPLRIDH